MLSYRDLTTLYVSPTGTGNGKHPHEKETGNGPLGSISAALTLLEQMRGGGMLQPITIRLLAGEYPLSAPLHLGLTMSNVTFEPFGDGPVLISGGKRITGFQNAVFNGVPCFAAHVPEVETGTWAFTDLYVDGLRADYTRYPVSGAFHMKETERVAPEHNSSSKWVIAEEADARAIAALPSLDGAILSFNHYWIDEHTPVESFDAESGKMTLLYHSRFTIRPGQDFILENVSATFSRPNEWYLDRAAGMLYYIPRDAAQTPENIDVWAPVTEQLIKISGSAEHPVTGVRFRNLHFAYTRGDYGSGLTKYGAVSDTIYASDSQAVASMDGVISIRYAHNITCSDCTMQNIGWHAYNISNGCRAVKIERCRIYDGGAGGVRICGGGYGTPEVEHTIGCAVTDCSITHMGRRYLSACGILIMYAAEIDIIHNDIGDLYYTGISCGWTWGYARTVCRDNRIIGNHIYDLGKGQLSDMGGVYLLGSQMGTIVAENRIHDIICKEYGGWALYTDEGSAGILLEKNLCYRTSSNSYHQHYGSSNVVRNNIFADAKDGLLRVSRPEAHLNILFENNILYSSGTEMVADYAQSFPGAFAIEDGGIVSRRNLLYCHTGDFRYCKEEGLQTFSDAQANGLEYESVVSDPLFADAANDDYTLLPDSPALALGFVPFDWKKSGVRTN